MAVHYAAKLPSLIAPDNISGLHAMAAEDWRGKTILAENGLGADLGFVVDASQAELEAFALRCVYACQAWAAMPDDRRPTVAIRRRCFGGSLEAALWAAITVDRANCEVGFPEYRAVNAAGHPVSWPFCKGEALFMAWSPVTRWRARPSTMLPHPPIEAQARVWARSIQLAVNLKALARAQRRLLVGQ